MDDRRGIFRDWCQEASLEPTEARFESFEAGYNARVRYVDQQEAEIARFREALWGIAKFVETAMPTKPVKELYSIKRMALLALDTKS